MMNRTQIVARFVYVIASLIVCSAPSPAQTTDPAIQCAAYPDVANYTTWLNSTDLAKNVPYRIADSRESAVRAAYSKIEIGMSRSAAERVMGKPDFENLMTGGPKGKPPTVCIDQWVYMFNKTSVIFIDSEDVAIYLTFAADGQLYWASPQNISLKPKGSAVRK